MFFLLIEIVVLNIESIKKFLLRLCNHFEKKVFLNSTWKKFHIWYFSQKQVLFGREILLIEIISSCKL